MALVVIGLFGGGQRILRANVQTLPRLRLTPCPYCLYQVGRGACFAIWISVSAEPGSKALEVLHRIDLVHLAFSV